VILVALSFRYFAVWALAIPLHFSSVRSTEMKERGRFGHEVKGNALSMQEAPFQAL
jgi:hypothetical protein